jgi:hypothetical protein
MEKYFHFFSGFSGLRDARYSLTDFSECPYLTLRPGGTRFKSRSKLTAVLLEAYHDLSQRLEADVRIVGMP